jgi:hypothetical protein
MRTDRAPSFGMTTPVDLSIARFRSPPAGLASLNVRLRAR